MRGVGEKEGEILGEADAARRDGERRADEELPGVEKGKCAAEGFFAVEVFEIGVGASGFGIVCAEFAADEAVAEREESPHDPSQQRLRAAHDGDDEWQRDKRADADHVNEIEAERGGGRQAAAQPVGFRQIAGSQRHPVILGL